MRLAASTTHNSLFKQNIGFFQLGPILGKASNGDSSKAEHSFHDIHPDPCHLLRLAWSLYLAMLVHHVDDFCFVHWGGSCPVKQQTGFVAWLARRRLYLLLLAWGVHLFLVHSFFMLVSLDQRNLFNEESNQTNGEEQDGWQLYWPSCLGVLIWAVWKSCWGFLIHWKAFLIDAEATTQRCAVSKNKSWDMS
jgi:hypothetical protein